MIDFANLVLKVDSRDLVQGEKAMGQLSKSGEQTEKSISRSTAGMSRAFGVVAGAAAGMLAALAPAALFGAAVSEARKFETTMFKVEAIIQATGGVAGRSADQLREQARQLAFSTLESTDGVLKAQQTLLTFRNVQGEVFDRAIESAADMAAALGGDLNGQIMQLAKALENPAQGLTALTRSGTVFTESQKEMVKAMVEAGRLAEAQTFILDELEAQYGGAAVAAAQGLAGAQDTLAQRFQEFKLAIAGTFGLLTIFTDANNGLANVVLRLTEVIADTDSVFALLDTTLTALGVTLAFIAGAQLPAFVVSIIAATSGISLMTIAANIATVSMRALGVAVAFAGGPWGILVGAVAAAAAYLLIFRDNSSAADIAAREAQAGTDALNTALGTFYQTAAPAAAKSAIEIANANYELADSSFEAARAELEKARAIEKANDIKFSNVRDAETGLFQDPEASLIVGAAESEAIRETNQALAAYDAALALLDQRQQERVRTGRAVTSSTFEAADATKIAETATTAAAEATEKLSGAQKTAKEDTDEATEALRQQKEIQDQLAQTAERLEGSFADTFTQVVTGAQSAREAVGNLLSSLAQMAINSAFKSLFAGMFDPVSWLFSAKGNAFSNGKVMPFANGGVVSGPTVFPMSGRQMGLMGEAGPEAIMPLSRGKDGKLGVQGEPQTIRLMVEAEEGKMFVPRVRQISGNVAVQVSTRVAKAQNSAFGSTIDTYDQRGTT